MNALFPDPNSMPDVDTLADPFADTLDHHGVHKLRSASAIVQSNQMEGDTVGIHKVFRDNGHRKCKDLPKEFFFNIRT